MTVSTQLYGRCLREKSENCGLQLEGIFLNLSRTQFHVNIQFHRVVGDDYTNNWTLIKRNYKATSI